MRNPFSRRKRIVSRFSVLRELMRGDRTYRNHEHAKAHMSRHALLDQHGNLIRQEYDSRARVLMDYAPLHGILRTISGDRLKGKRILHLGASAGVYTRFLHDKFGMLAVNLDLNREGLQESRKRGSKHPIESSAIHERMTGKGFVQSKSGLFVPEEYVHHLPFREKSFDFIVSENFLFSDYHPRYHFDRGFEEAPGSFRKSEDTLHELNRIMKKNGHVVISHVHGADLRGFHRYQKGKIIHGFVIEEVLDGSMEAVGGEQAVHLVLKKIRDDKKPVFKN